MAERAVYLTREGYKRLDEELVHLRTVKRPQVSERIRQSKDMTDVEDNAEYDEAKSEQSFIEGRIQELEALLALADIIDISKLSGSTVTFGATVTVADTDSGEEKVYQIVGEDEADIKQNLISVTSPIARSLVGRQEGDIVKMKAPNGRDRELEIISVKYIDS